MPIVDQDMEERIWVALATQQTDTATNANQHWKTMSALVASCWNWLLSAVKVLFQFLGITLSVIIFAEILIETFFQHVVQIDSFAVPQRFVEEGYTTQTVDNRIVGEILRIERAGHTRARQDFAAASGADLPEIEVPATKLSLRAIVLLLQDFLRIQPPRFSGEITVLPPTSGADTEKSHLLITIRLIRPRERLFGKIDAPSPDPEFAISLLARESLRVIDPYVLAVYALNVESHPKEAIELCRRAIELDPKNAAPYDLWGIALAEYEHDFDGAITMFRKAIEIDPKLAVAYSGWGTVLAKYKHDPDGAIAKFQKAIELDPRLPDAYSGWGSVLADYRHDPDGAIAKFQKAIQLNPAYAPAYSNWGAVLRDAKHEPDAAIVEFRKAIELNPKLPAAYEGWGSALWDKHNPDGAIAKFQEAIELDPNSAIAYNGWGNALYDKRDPDGAIAKFRKAIELDPTLAFAYIGWGNTLAFYKHDLDGAIEKYRKATELQPNLPVAYENWGRALFHKHDLASAIAKFKKVLELDPNNEAARNALNFLEKASEGRR